MGELLTRISGVEQRASRCEAWGKLLDYHPDQFAVAPWTEAQYLPRTDVYGNQNHLPGAGVAFRELSLLADI